MPDGLLRANTQPLLCVSRYFSTRLTCWPFAIAALAFYWLVLAGANILGGVAVLPHGWPGTAALPEGLLGFTAINGVWVRSAHHYGRAVGLHHAFQPGPC